MTELTSRTQMVSALRIVELAVKRREWSVARSWLSVLSDADARFSGGKLFAEESLSKRAAALEKALTQDRETLIRRRLAKYREALLESASVQEKRPAYGAHS